MLKIRLRRMGSTHSPFYRVVVSDSRRTPRASVLEEVGHYNPISNPVEIRIDSERVEQWVAKGAQMSPTVKRLLRRQMNPLVAAAPEAVEAAVVAPSATEDAPAEPTEAAEAAEETEAVEVAEAAEAEAAPVEADAASAAEVAEDEPAADAAEDEPATETAES